jgi:hypothetical protein
VEFWGSAALGRNGLSAHVDDPVLRREREHHDRLYTRASRSPIFRRTVNKEAGKIIVTILEFYGDSDWKHSGRVYIHGKRAQCGFPLTLPHLTMFRCRWWSATYLVSQVRKSQSGEPVSARQAEVITVRIVEPASELVIKHIERCRPGQSPPIM